MRAGWVTDVHLNFLPLERRALFYEQIHAAKLDALLVGGDIGEADSVGRFLGEFARVLEIPIYFVLGNHDFYRGSIAGVREAARSWCSSIPGLHWLPAEDVIELTPGTALIGHDSWTDGRLGDYDRSEILLNDYLLIQELTGLTKPQRLEKLKALGDEASAFLEQRARQALTRFPNLLVLTHVPPFRESCWHEGRISDDDWLPHFSCKSAGEKLVKVMREHLESSMTVLCGHTHGSGTAQILPNLRVLTGGAEYGFPTLQQVFELR